MFEKAMALDFMLLDEQQYHTIKNYLEERPPKSAYVRILRFILDNPFCSERDVFDNCDSYMPQHFNTCCRKIVDACYPCGLARLTIHHQDGKKTKKYAILNFKE